MALRGVGKNNEEISAIIGYNPDWVSRLVSIYKNEGIEQLANDDRKGGNQCNISKSEAAEFLSQFNKKAKKGK